MTDPYIHLSPRLEVAVSLVSACHTVADIGCDHGRTVAALIQRKLCNRVIATDISRESLLKAKSLLRYIGLDQAVSFRLGDGFSVLDDSECDSIMMLGIGGTLMARILSEPSHPLKGARNVILQPMRAQADIREYLHRNNFRITDDLIVKDHGRFYQVIKAFPDRGQQPVPNGWPDSFYDLGFVSYVNKEKLLYDLAESLLSVHLARLSEAKGSPGEAIIARKIACLNQVLNLL